MQKVQILEQDNIFILESIEKLRITFVSDSTVTDSLCGAWKDERTAEEIIEGIYRSRLISSQVKPEL